MENEKELIKAFQEYAWMFWGNGKTPSCIRCWKPAVTLHEIEPRSTYREWYTDVKNSVPICNDCHDWAHRNGEYAKESLRGYVEERIRMLRLKILEEYDGP